MFVLQESWVVLLFLSLLPVVRPFYVPGVAPIDFHQSDIVEIKVRTALFSFTTLYYRVYILLRTIQDYAYVYFKTGLNGIVC